MAFGPSHLSCYGLVFEKGTALWKQREQGEVRPLDEELERSMYETTIDRLSGAGLAMYEISNFARPGHESRHNLVYWANDAYFGFGVGAARYVRGVRSVNTRELPAYLRRIESGEPATGPSEELTPEERAARRLSSCSDGPPWASTATTSVAGPASTSTRSPGRPSNDTGPAAIWGTTAIGCGSAAKVSSWRTWCWPRSCEVRFRKAGSSVVGVR